MSGIGNQQYLGIVLPANLNVGAPAWDASGNLGINGATPADTINFGRVIDAASASLGAGAYFRNSATAYFGAVGYDGSAGYLGTWGASAGPLRIYTNGTERICVDTTGYLGIGATSPAAPLHIVSGAQEQLRLGRASTASSAYLTFFANNSSSVQVQYAGILGDVASSTAGSHGGNLLFYTTSSGSSAERVRIDAGGQVGIGVIPVSAMLHIKGNWNGGHSTIKAQTITSLASGGVVGYGVYDSDGTRTGLFYASSGPLVSLETYTAIPITINPGGSERFRFDTSGNLLIGTTVTQGGMAGGVQLGSSTNLSSSTNPSIFLSTKYSSTAGVPHLVGNSPGPWWGLGTHSGSSTTDVRIGLVTANTNGWYWSGSYPSLYSGAYTNASDYRIKDEIRDYDADALSLVMQMRTRFYRLKSQPEKQDLGFIAHEMQEVVPEIVTGEKDELNGEGEEQHQGIDYSKISTVLVKAMQQQQALIESQASAIASLTARLNALEAA